MNEADKVCNIYDLEGGKGEWTVEQNVSGYPCNARGEPASKRWSGAGAADAYNTFRIVLYVI